MPVIFGSETIHLKSLIKVPFGSSRLNQFSKIIFLEIELAGIESIKNQFISIFLV
jgi:hypothetical protein